MHGVTQDPEAQPPIPLLLLELTPPVPEEDDAVLALPPPVPEEDDAALEVDEALPEEDDVALEVDELDCMPSLAQAVASKTKSKGPRQARLMVLPRFSHPAGRRERRRPIRGVRRVLQGEIRSVALPAQPG